MFKGKWTGFRHVPLWTDWQTDMTESFTFLQTTYAGSNGVLNAPKIFEGTRLGIVSFSVNCTYM